MEFNTSIPQTGEFSSKEIIVRQSSDRDPVSGLMKYSVHTSLQIQTVSEVIYGPWKGYEVDLIPGSVAVICSRMGITLEDLNDIGTDYAKLLKAIVDYSQNPPDRSELEALGFTETLNLEP